MTQMKTTSGSDRPADAVPDCPGYSREELLADIKKKTGRDVSASLDRFIESGMFVLSADKTRLFKSQFGAEIAAEYQGVRSHIEVYLNDSYTLDDGRQVKGQSLSFLVTSIRQDRVMKMPAYSSRQEDLLKKLGFSVQSGRNSRGTPVTVVFKESKK